MCENVAHDAKGLYLSDPVAILNISLFNEHKNKMVLYPLFCLYFINVTISFIFIVYYETK